MDKELVRQLLPEEPPAGLLRWTLANCDDELGRQYLVWKPEKVPVYDMQELMDNSTRPKRHERVAHCTCLKCGYDFRTELLGNDLQFWIDDCGDWWAMDPDREQLFEDEDEEQGGYTVDVDGDGEALSCPMCYETLTTIPAKNLRGGRRKQILVVSIETIKEYAAVVYWLVRRKIYDGGNDYSVHPRDAYVLDERGTIHRYTHTSGGGYTQERDDGGWRLAGSKKDSLDSVYHDWGSISNEKKGGIFYEDVPDLDGTTAEKTGLECYANFDGTYSVEYLKLWKKHRNLENLVNTGWNMLVRHIVEYSFDGHDAQKEMEKVLDITKSKPHEMLNMSRADFKAIRKAGKQWNYDTQLLYRQYRAAGFTSAIQFREYVDKFKESGIRAVGQLQARYGDADFEKLERYLSKQKMLPSEVGILLDTRNAAQVLAGNRPLTMEELWPRNLQATHDRLTRARLVKIDPKTAERYQQGFDDVYSRYSQLEWTDKDLCIVIPKSYADLVQEGNVLRHCVGGYSTDHIEGSHMIFFVRHYRRPERSYYTLDINMLDRPYRQQLHGYGNERHGVNKEYRHSIPQKVLDFCDRWQREVLMPWYRQQQENQKKEGKTA